MISSDKFIALRDRPSSLTARLTLADGMVLSTLFCLTLLLGEDGRVDAIAAFLQEELQPGDRVQPLDFVSGGVNNALLQAGAVLATRYQFDSQLYHHVSSSFTQTRQQDFLSQLQAGPPRFVIEYPDRPRPTGIDTIQSLPELQRFIVQNYELAQVGRGYLIYERAQ